MIIQCKYDELVDVDELAPYPKNRNRHTPSQIDRLAKLLRYQGIRAPIIVSKLSNCIVKGHGTLAAIKQNSWLKAPVVYQDFEDDEAEYSFVQSDNAIAAWSDLDMAQINLDIADLGPEFDLDHLGLKDFTLDFEDKIQAINHGDENAEWVDMPEFEEGDGYIRVILQFGSEEARFKYITENKLEIFRKMKSAWIVNL